MSRFIEVEFDGRKVLVNLDLVKIVFETSDQATEFLFQDGRYLKANNSFNSIRKTIRDGQN